MDNSELTSKPNSDLMLALMAFINENGGRQRLADKLEMEWLRPEIGRYHRWTNESINFVINSFERLSVKRMAQILNLSVGVVESKIRDLKKDDRISTTVRKPKIHLDVLD